MGMSKFNLPAFTDELSVHTYDCLDTVVSECCGAEWDYDTGICLECKEHAEGTVIPYGAGEEVKDENV